MRKNLLILFTVLFYTASAQEFEALDGNTYKVGDSVLIGIHTDYKSYDDIKEYYTDGYRSGYRDVKKNIAFKKYLITSVGRGGQLAKKMYWDAEDIIIRFGTKKFLGGDYYARLNYAIQSGEIVSRLPTEGNRVENPRLNDSIAFFYFVKSTSIPIEDFSEEYLYRFMNDIYTSSHEDEFEYSNSVEKAKKELISILPNVDFNEDFSLYKKFYLDNYDFENKGFLIKSKNLKSKVVNIRGEYYGVDIIFLEFEKYRFVSIEPNLANSYIKRKKNRYGSIDREVYARINYKIIDVDASKFNNDNHYSGNRIFGKISSIELYEFDNYHYNWIGTIK